MTKKQKEVQKIVEELKQRGLKEGKIVYGKVTHVARSGMSRNIRLYIITDNEPHDISFWASKALGYAYKEGYNGGIRVGGCGMDMIFATIGNLSHCMGYGSLNQGKPSESKGLIYKAL